MEEDFAIVSLKCNECECDKCGFAFNWTHPKSKKGCRRKVPQEIADEYTYRIIDMPFYMKDEKIDKKKKVEALNELIEWLNKNIYDATYVGPIGDIGNLI